jgi:hypothetical protein
LTKLWKWESHPKCRWLNIISIILIPKETQLGFKMYTDYRRSSWVYATAGLWELPSTIEHPVVDALFDGFLDLFVIISFVSPITGTTFFPYRGIFAPFGVIFFCSAHFFCFLVCLLFDGIFGLLLLSSVDSTVCQIRNFIKQMVRKTNHRIFITWHRVLSTDDNNFCFYFTTTI